MSRTGPTAEQVKEVPEVELLDAYVSALRAGQEPARSELLARHPELAEAVECLEGLECLARAASLSGPKQAFEDLPTLAPTTSVDGDVPLVGQAQTTPFGKYELLATLGRGGMGVVYKARQMDLDRLVALKMILASQFASAEQVQRFHAEVKAAAGLHHPHIIQVYDAGQVHGQHYFAMQYIEGPSLATRLRGGPLSPTEGACCLLKVDHAVAYLHSRGIVHRDLKPSNILLDQQGCPYVGDFGLVKLAQSTADLTGSGAIVGTPSYMAPEQAAGRNAEVGPWSDVYSLGAILFEMLTGRPPYCEPTPLDTLVQVLEAEPPLPRSLNPKAPRELELICLKAMARAPQQRYASATALAEDLERFLQGEPVHARPQRVSERILRWVRQEPGLACRLAVLVTVAMISQVYYHMAHPVGIVQHIAIMAVLGAWLLTSALAQAIIRRDVWPERVRVIWLAADVCMLTAVLILDEAFLSPLVLAYGVLIVASGLWFRVGLVWFTTVTALLGYPILVAVGAYHGRHGPSPQHHLIVLVGLAALGLMVAAQVRRVRALSRYYGHRPMP